MTDHQAYLIAIAILMHGYGTSEKGGPSALIVVGIVWATAGFILT